MSLQDFVHVFIPEVRVAFEAYLNNVNKLEKTLMNTIKHVQYLYFLANLEQKIIEKNKVERAQIHAKKCQVIKEFCIDLRRQLRYFAQKKEILPSPKPLFMTPSIISRDYILLEDIIDTKRRFSK